MKKNPLEVISTETQSPNESHKKLIHNKRTERQARFDRLWLKDPEKFNPMRKAEGRERVKRTWSLMLEFIKPENHLAVDLGCAAGHFTFKLRDNGASVHAVDISSKPLDLIKKNNTSHIELRKDYLPKSLLPDETYDIVFATDIIATLDKEEYRLFFSELARIINAEGYLICSTPIDVYSEDALQYFADLAATEFDILKWTFSYHRLHISTINFFKAPSRFFKAWKDPLYRKHALEKRYSLNKQWFRMNSTVLPASLWFLVKFLFSPVVNFLEANGTLILLQEKISRIFWRESAISHAIFIAKRRAIMPITSEEAQPQETKHKKQVWE